MAVVVYTVASSVKRELLEELLYAGDLAITAKLREELQPMLYDWQRAMEAKGIKVNSRKTEVVVSTKNDSLQVNIVDIHGDEIKQIDKFYYPGQPSIRMEAARRK